MADALVPKLQISDTKSAVVFPAEKRSKNREQRSHLTRTGVSPSLIIVAHRNGTPSVMSYSSSPPLGARDEQGYFTAYRWQSAAPR